MTSETVHVIVDTDGGLDDALALVYLAQHPQAELVAASSVHGNVPAASAGNNTLRVLELAGDTSTPVAIGAAEPLAQDRHLRHPEDPFGSLAGLPKRTPTAETGAAQLVRLARQHPGELSLLAIGPLTNLALAVQAEPALPELLRHVVMMGGALHTHGNITEAAESNVWHDPEAAERVFKAGFPLTVAGLDVTRNATATPTWLQALATDTESLWGQYAAHLLKQYGTDSVPPLPLHDPTAAALLLEPELATYETIPLHVEVNAGKERGRLLTTASTSPAVAVATGLDVGGCRAHLLRTIAPNADMAALSG